MSKRLFEQSALSLLQLPTGFGQLGNDLTAGFFARNKTSNAADIVNATTPSDTSSQQPHLLTWKEAVDHFVENHRFMLPATKPSIRTLTPTQTVVAQLLWDNRQEIKQNPQRVVHISNAAGLVAAYSARQQLVQLKQQSSAPGALVNPQNLHYRILPSSAELLDGQNTAGFTNVSLAHLMWLYGQTSAGAAHDMPDLRDHPLSVRRFPNVSPALLELRHLGLIHQLSQSSLSFNQLQREIDDEDAPHLCADIASLFYTGVLRIAAA